MTYTVTLMVLAPDDEWEPADKRIVGNPVAARHVAIRMLRGALRRYRRYYVQLDERLPSGRRPTHEHDRAGREVRVWL